MPTITPVSHSPLTDSDITRLPQGAVNSAVGHDQIITAMPHDTYGYGVPESHTLRNTIIGLVVAAAAIVGLKHCSFMQVKDVSNMKWYDHIKSWNNKLGGWIEKPFVWTYKTVKGWFGGHKASEPSVPKAPESPAPKAPETPAPKTPEAPAGTK